MDKIVLFDGTLQQGGAERVISILSRRLVEQGYKVEILLYYDREIFYDIHPDIKIVTVEGVTKSKNLLKNLRFIRCYFKKNVDTIVSFLAPFNIIAILSHLRLQ